MGTVVISGMLEHQGLCYQYNYEATNYAQSAYMTKVENEWRKKLNEPKFDLENAKKCPDTNHMISQKTVSGVKMTVYGKGEDQFTVPIEDPETELWGDRNVMHGLTQGKCFQIWVSGKNLREDAAIEKRFKKT